MSRLMDELTQRSIFDSCIYTFLAELKKECFRCPLCTDSFEEIANYIRIHSQTRFLSYCDRYPIMVALRVSLEEVCESDICFFVINYPVAMSLNNIKKNGANENRLHTPKSFYYFYNRSVNLTLYLEMIKAECTRFKLPRFKKSLM